MRPNARLFVLLARTAPIAVIFRRGPAKHVLMITWNLEQDTFEYGQWFKGRIYERRCDLSPEGDMLLYFAGNHRKPYYTWSAVSRPPFFTALALWPIGDTWGGGGLFPERNHIALRHGEIKTSLAPDFALPKWMTVSQFGNGMEGIEPIWSARLERDGWKLTRSPQTSKDDYGAKMMHEFDPPITWQRPHPLLPDTYVLQMEILGISERNGPWYVIDHAILEKNGAVQKIGRSDWADWSHEGDLLFAQSGSLYRLQYKNGALGTIEESNQLADFSQLSFEQKEPTRRALQ
jgi:hypothetical protein